MPFFIHELEKRGKRLISIEEFADLVVPMDIADDSVWINEYGAITDTAHDILIAIRTSKMHFRFMPGPEFSPRIYRGETEFHAMCVPSMFRSGINNIDRSFAIGKWIELSVLMEHHPATQDLMSSRIGKLLFGFNIEAIAQHYGFRTGLLDFSRSKDIAMFFATCHYDPETESYCPLVEGTAVLYIADLKGLIKHRSASASFLPLGLEPLPRPEAQRALAIRLNPGENLNHMPWIKHMAIKITPDLSRHYFEMFDGGAKLFPQNPFDDHVRTIQKSKLLPLEALAFGMDLGLLPPHDQGIEGARTALIAAGYKVELSPMNVDPTVIQTAADAWDQQKSIYYGRIRVRGIADHFVES